MNCKKIFLVSIILFIALSLSTVSAESIDNVIENSNDIGVNSDLSTKNSINMDYTLDKNSKNINNTVLSGDDLTKYYGNDSKYSLNLKDGLGSPISNQNVSVSINGKNYTSITDDEGNAYFDTMFTPGNYTIKGTFDGFGNYTPSNVTNILLIKSTIISNNLTKYYKNDTQFIATFLDKEGNLLKNRTIIFKIGSSSYERITDENGKAKLNINLAPGKYTVTSINTINNESVNNSVTVLTTIAGKDVVKYFRNGTKYFATVLDGNGNPLAKRDVTFNIYGVFYNRTTDENGTVRLNINLAPGKYIVTAENPINNEKTSNNITVLSTISGKDVVKYFRNGTQYFASLLDGNGNPLAKRDVTFNIYGVFYKRATDENGTVKLNINLAPGKYIVTAENPINNEKTSNNITVLSKLITKDIKLDYKSGKYSVKVVDDTGKAVVNATVDLNIYGVFYHRVTDANGTAYLNINLNPGKYIITASYKESKVSSTIEVNKIKVKIDVLDGTVKKNDFYKVKVTNSKTKEAIVGQQVIFIYDKKAWGANTDVNGIAKIRIGLNPGSYQLITAIQDSLLYENIALYNTVKVIP